MEAIVLSAKEISKIENPALNPNQLDFILKKTPQKYIKKRPAKGGGTWDYVSVSYIEKCLNMMFGFDWDFEVIDEKVLLDAGEVVVKGKLTCRSNGKVITKMQFGNKDIAFKRDSKIPFSIGNDLKSASSDALKKCASLIGIAKDVYSKEDFKEVVIQEAYKRDIAKEIVECKSNDELDLLWSSLSENEQNIYKPIFDVYKI